MLLVAFHVGGGVGARRQYFFAAFAHDRKDTFHQTRSCASSAQRRRCFDVRNDQYGVSPPVVGERDVTDLLQFEAAARRVVDDAVHEFSSLRLRPSIPYRKFPGVNLGPHLAFAQGGFTTVKSIAFVLLFFGVVAGATAAPADGPWLDPANADKYVFVGKDVWDVATGKIVAAGGAPLVYQDSRPVAGVTDRLWMHPTERGLPGLPAEGLLYSTTDIYANKHPTLDGKPYTSMGDFPGFWIASDLRRAVWIDKGDFWRGTVDWTKGLVVDRKQVTSVGVFNGKSPVLWYGHLLFVNGGFDPQKPIVRIDLKSGATEEMETQHVFNTTAGTYADAAAAAGMVSPSARNLISITAETIYTFDASTGKAGTVHNVLFNNNAVSGTPILIDNGHPPHWLDDDTVIFVNPQAVVTKLDLHKQEMQVLFPAPPPQGFRVYPPLPGGRYLDVRGAIPGGQGEPAVFKERFLIDLASGQKIPTSLPADADNGMWLDDSKFAYVRKTGGLSGVGTWVYDRHTNESKRIAPAQLETTRMTLLRGGREIWAVNTAGGVTLTRAKVDGSGSEDLGPSQMFAPMQFPVGPPVDLGLTSASKDPWAQ